MREFPLLLSSETLTAWVEASVGKSALALRSEALIIVAGRLANSRVPILVGREEFVLDDRTVGLCVCTTVPVSSVTEVAGPDASAFEAGAALVVAVGTSGVTLPAVNELSGVVLKPKNRAEPKTNSNAATAAPRKPNEKPFSGK